MIQYIISKDQLYLIPNLPGIYFICIENNEGIHVQYIGTAHNLKKRLNKERLQKDFAWLVKTIVFIITDYELKQIKGYKKNKISFYLKEDWKARYKLERKFILFYNPRLNRM